VCVCVCVSVETFYLGKFMGRKH